MKAAASAWLGLKFEDEDLVVGTRLTEKSLGAINAGFPMFYVRHGQLPVHSRFGAAFTGVWTK